MPPVPSPQPVSSVALRQTALPPELELVMAACAAQGDAGRAARLRELLRQPLDGQRVLDLAEYHGVVPLAYLNLPGLRDLVPPALLASLRARYESNARQTLGLTRELLRILDDFERRGIPAIPYKGPALAETLYQNVALRQFSDLDILIHAADLPRVRAAVRELGYEPGLRLTKAQERAYLATGYELTFDSAAGRNLLEIQWQILPRFYAIAFDLEGFFQRASMATVGGRQVRTLSTGDLLLVLCAHAAKHGWARLSWTCDIAAVIQTQSIEWDAVWQQARLLGVERIVSVSLKLAHDLLGVSVPAPWDRILRLDPQVDDVCGQATANIIRSAGYDTGSFSYFRLMMRSRERRRDRLRLLWRLASTPSVGEWSLIRFSGPLFPLYRVLRVFRLIGKLL